MENVVSGWCERSGFFEFGVTNIHHDLQPNIAAATTAVTHTVVMLITHTKFKVCHYCYYHIHT